MNRGEIFLAITAERERQAVKWAGEHDWGHGDCSGDGVALTAKLTVLVEEVGEVARAILDQDGDGLRREAVQVAAVACAILESLP
jgi:NTP pyrophosphatase (non-canonical NTP hydrolase)